MQTVKRRTYYARTRACMVISPRSSDSTYSFMPSTAAFGSNGPLLFFSLPEALQNIHAYMHSIHTCMHKYIHACIHACKKMHAYMHACMWMRPQVRIFMHAASILEARFACQRTKTSVSCSTRNARSGSDCSNSSCTQRASQSHTS